jgi:hypothetical protein
MSNRVVAIKILGLGTTASTLPAVFTTRAHPLYPAALEGTVVSLADQLSSEIAVFGSLGSDSTTSFTILSTAATRALLMSRGRTEVLDPADGNQPVRVQDYILPDPGTVTIPVTNPALFTVGGYYRIQNTVFKITSNSPTLQADRAWGCRAVPIALMQQAPRSLLGSKVYDLNGGNPLGGCEQLPVVIETVDLDSTTPEVIFRGYISKVSNDTSSGQTNLIKVDCSSMMAYLKQAPFTPAWGDVSARLQQGIGTVYDREGAESMSTVWAETPFNSRLYGELYTPASPVTGATVSKLWQLRQEGLGGIAAADLTTVPGSVTISSIFNITYSGTVTSRDNGYRMVFRDGYYDYGDSGPVLSFDVELQNVPRERGDTSDRRRSYRNRVQNAQPGIRGENCIEAYTLSALIIDIIMGTYNTDLTMVSGARSVNEAAWLPFDVASWTDLIDAPSLNALTAGIGSPDVPQSNFEQSIGVGDLYSTILPYMHNSVKTVGEVLEGILKRLAGFMVYDQGKFYFGSWAGARQTPTFVNDSAFSDPSIRLNFERGTSLMRVNATYCTDISDKPVTFDVPFQNPDLASSGLGKTTTVGHWQVVPYPPDQTPWALTKMVANAFGLLMRYSQSAARVDLSLRDSVVDLNVGQEIALSSQYLVNSAGGMGISVLTGYVLKAARSWQTPTTAYTIILPGYLSPAAYVSVWSCSGLVVDVPGGDDIEIEQNFFTAPPIISSDGAPADDADAFKRTYDLLGSWYGVQLLDQYGTLKHKGALTGVSGNFLTLPGFDAYAVPGDIIILDSAVTFTPFDSIWDVFQADSAGQVVGLTANARKWVP